MFGAGFAKKVIEEVNKLRADPAPLSKKITEYMSYFKGKILTLPKEAGIETAEGKDAYKEAADFLSKAPKLPELKVNPLLMKIAEEMVAEMKKCKDEAEMDKINRNAIIKKHGHYDGRLSDSTDYGSLTPQMVVINLIVDDGNKSRSNRKLLYRDDFKEIGVANTVHDDLNTITHLVFATDFSEGPGKMDDVLLPYEEEQLKQQQAAK